MQDTEETIFNDADARHMAFGQPTADDLLPVKFEMGSRYNEVKSKGGLVIFDRYKDTEHLEKLKGELDGLGLKYSEKEKDDTFELRVTGAGRPIFDSVEYVEIRVPMDKTQINRVPVNEDHRRRFAKRYRAWKAGKSQAVQGTPLSEWPPITKAMVDELAHVEIHTVEQLANTPDGNVANFGPIMGLKQKAKDYLAAAKGFAPTEQLREEMAAKDQQIDSLNARLAALEKLAAQSVEPMEQEEPKKRGPGRPRKEEA